MLNDITMLFTYPIHILQSFIGYEDAILEVISNSHVPGAEFGGKRTNLADPPGRNAGIFRLGGI